MADELQSKLLDRLAKARLSPLLATSVSRRSFMAGLVLSAAAGKAAELPMHFRPRARWSGSSLIIAYGRRSWVLDRDAFGIGARLTLHPFADSFRVQLRRAFLPGTRFPVDFTFEVARRERQWIARIAMPAFRVVEEVLLDHWLAGRPIVRRLAPSRTAMGKSELRVGHGHVAIRSANGLTFHLTAPLRLLGPCDCSAAGATLHPARSVLLPDDSPSGWSTHIGFDAPAMRPRGFACGEGDVQAITCPTAVRRLEGEFFDGVREAAQALLATGAARLEMRRAGQIVAPILFDQAAVLLAARTVGIAGDIGEAPFAVRTRRCMASVARATDAPFCAVFKAGESPQFTAAVSVSDVRLALDGGGFASVSPLLVPVALTTAAGPAAAGPAADGRAVNRVVLNGDPRLVVDLDGTSLSLRSGPNLLNLVFQFEGFRLEEQPAGIRLVRRRSNTGACVAGIIRIIFPPQHISETIQPIVNASCPTPKGGMEQKYSDISRIVFALPEEPFAKARWRARELTVKALLNWSGLPLSVHPRAKAQNPNLKEELASQLRVATIERQDSLETVLSKIAAIATAPDDDMTSLELADSLVFSPSGEALWDMREIGEGPATPIFGVRLGRLNDPHLRALSSRLLKNPFPEVDELDLPRDSYRPLTHLNHWEIIGQTSTYGLPALRRDIPPGTGEPPRKEVRSDPGAALAKVPRANVIRPAPDEDYDYLGEIDRLLAGDLTPVPSPTPPETGIAIASAFQTADVTLTSLGATMRLDWHGDPPSLRPKKRRIGKYMLPESFSLERLAYQSWLGRDVRVVAVTKGYLIPFGMRASLLTVAERVFMPEGRDSVVARELIRSFIVSPRVAKYFPAINQPDGGRDFPVSSLTLLTNRTPDLVPCDTEDNGSLSIGFGPKDGAFWPKYRDMASGKPTDVAWKTMIDDDPAPLVNAMIFITNSAADDPIYLEQVIGKYNGTLRSEGPKGRADWVPRNTAKLNGSRRRYAPPGKVAGSKVPTIDTAFDTDSWLLVARGRASADGDNESFIVDARMNSADQPAFYPSIARTSISIQSVDRLVGSPQGLVEARLLPDYVRNGFGTRRAPNLQNKGEIFLEVLGSTVSMNPAAAGQPAAGGVAQPDTQVRALSRVTGVVGSKAPASDGAGGGAGSIADALAGRFNPKQFFDLCILGVDLIDCIADPGNLSLATAPLLTELVDYGVTEDLFKNTVRPLAGEVLGLVVRLRAKIDTGIAEFNASLPSHQPAFSFATLYPDLAQNYQDAMGTIVVQLTALSQAADVKAIPTVATQLSVAAKPLIEEIGKAIRDPIPQAISEEIDEIVGQWNQLQSLFLALPTILTKDFTAGVNSQITALNGLAADELALLFGLQNGETLASIASQPDARARLGATLLYDTVGRPFLALLDSLGQIAAGIDGAVLFDRTALEVALGDLIADQISAFADRLIDSGALPSNILRKSDAALVAYALAQALNAGLKDLTGKGDLAGAPDRLRAVMKDLEGGGPARDQLRAIISTEVDRASGWIETIEPADLAAVRRTFKKQVADVVGALAISSAISVIGKALPFLELRASEASNAIFGVIMKALVAPFAFARGLVRISAVTEAAGRIPGWCSTASGGAFELACALADGLLSSQTDTDQAIETIAREIASVTLPPSIPATAVERFGRIKAALLANIDILRSRSQALASARTRLGSLSSADICSTTAALPQALAAAVQARAGLTDALRSAAAEIAAVDAFVADTSDPTGSLKLAVQPHLDALVVACRAILAGASLAGPAAAGGQWSAVVAPTAARLAQAVKVADFDQRLTDGFDRLAAQKQAVAAALGTAKASDLPAVASLVVDLSAVDRRFAGIVLETFALTENGRKKAQDVALELVHQVATPLVTIHKRALDLLAPLADLPRQYPALDYLLGGDIETFQKAYDEIPVDLETLKGLAGAGDLATTLAYFKSLMQSWNGRPMPLVAATKSLATMVDKILQGQIGTLLGDSIRAMFNELQDRLSSVVDQFIPTKVHTSYTWNTALAGNGMFSIVTSTPRDLVINSEVSFDFRTKERKASVTGTLSSFCIDLMPLLKITFKDSKFESLNGSAPHFEADIKDVELGSALEFLKTFQSLAAPGGNGFYVLPRPDGIKVGYAFACEVKQIGSLTLSNIALDVYANLPFDARKSEFGFLFASKERPFLISNPPYGGGGWVAIRCYAGGQPDIALSFMFGAVTEIAFGPLKGHGRICAGIEYQSATEKLTAFVEAVGEGSIACFSISIYIGIFLTHYNNGDFIGEARYEFKFKVGFVTLKYGVTARYTIAGNNKQQTNSAALATPAQQEKSAGLMSAIPALLDEIVSPAFAQAPPPVRITHQSKVPVKSRNWDRYRKLVSMELLNA